MCTRQQGHISKVADFTYPPSFGAPVGSDRVRISPRSLASENQTPWAIAWWTYMFSRFGRTERRTDRRTHHDDGIYRASIASCGKNTKSYNVTCNSWLEHDCHAKQSWNDVYRLNIAHKPNIHCNNYNGVGPISKHTWQLLLPLVHSLPSKYLSVNFGLWPWSLNELDLWTFDSVKRVSSMLSKCISVDGDLVQTSPPTYTDAVHTYMRLVALPGPSN